MNEQFDSNYKENQTLAESVGIETQEMESIELQKNVMSNNDRSHNAIKMN